MALIVIGSKGNMGKRYCAILESLGHDYIGFDKDDNPNTVLNYALRSDGVIIATPTDNHLYWLDLLVLTGTPILCEKPLSKNIREVRERLLLWAQANVKLRMINQYAELSTSEEPLMTRYDFHKHGNDGLAWDCISIIRLAEGDIKLEEESLVWTCEINGQPMALKDMEKAYVTMIRNWVLGHHTDDMLELLDAHEAASILQLAMDAKNVWN